MMVMPSFNSILQAVYPVGVTDLQLNFTRQILHNPNRIPTKSGTKMCFNEPFMSLCVPSFSSMVDVFVIYSKACKKK